MTNQDNEKVYFSVVLVPLTLGFLVCGYRFFVKGWADEFHQVVPVTGATSVNVVASDDGPSSSAPSVEAMEANRKEVLKTLFPVSDGRNEGTRMLLAYDVGSKKYIRQNSTESNVVASPSCSICLEGFDSSACIVTAACEHSYHYQCIMDWVAKRDDCPNCRASMWDEEEFKRLMEEEMITGRV